MKSNKSLSLAALACLGALALSCTTEDRNPAGASQKAEATGSAGIFIRTGKVGALAKAATVDLDSLYVSLAAPGEDTLHQTFPLAGNAASSVSHLFTGLASLKTWTLSARSVDVQGRTIHSGSTTFEVRPRQTASVTLDLSALFSMLKASFFPIRDSVTRLELWVDGVRQEDSAFAKQSALGDTIPMAFDYLSTGQSHAIRMDVYGEMWGFDTLLYTEDTVLNIAAGQDASHRLLLKWVGPASPPPGQAGMSVALGAVGTVDVIGELEPRTRAIAFATSGPVGSVDMSIHAGALYVSASNDGNGGEGLVMKFALPLGSDPEWNLAWPNQPGWDMLMGVGAHATGVYAAGRSWSRTSDNVGGKESKGITVRFPLTGASGAGFGGSDWERQTPSAPGAFPYGGHEGLEALHVTEEEGVPYVYVAGGAQAGFSNDGRLFLSKLERNGNVLWTATDAVGNPASIGYDVVAWNGGIYVAGERNDPGVPTVYLRKFNQAGAPLWSQGNTQGTYTGLAAADSALYAVGFRRGGAGGSLDFLIEKWSESGALLWSRSYDRNSEEDRLEDAVVHNGRLYAVGSSRGGTAGGRDGVLLGIELATGDLLDSRLHGGAAEESFHAVGEEGADVYAAGMSGSAILVVRNP